MWVAGGGALTPAAVILPAHWVARLRLAVAQQRRMELRLTITCERANDVQEELREAYAQVTYVGGGENSMPRFTGHKWPRSVYLDAQADSGGLVPAAPSSSYQFSAQQLSSPQSSPHHTSAHFARSPTGWDPHQHPQSHQQYAYPPSAAVRYEHELAGEPLDQVVTLRVLPSMVSQWQHLPDNAVRLVFVGDWGSGGSCVRVRAEVWERVALPDTFRPQLDARHRCQIDGQLVCQLGYGGSTADEGLDGNSGSTSRHFEDVPLDEGNLARAERLALDYQQALRENGLAARVEMNRQLSSPSKSPPQQQRVLSAPITPRRVAPSPHIEVEIARLEANVQALRSSGSTATSSEVDGGGGFSRRDSPLRVSPSPAPSPSQQRPKSSTGRRGVTDSPHLEYHHHHQQGTEMMMGGGATIMLSEAEQQRTIRVLPSPLVSPSPSGPPSPRTYQPQVPRGRLAPLHVYTGDSGGAGGMMSPQPPGLATQQLSSSMRGRPLLTPQHSMALSASSSSLGPSDPFRAHYAPEVSHLPPGSSRPPSYRAASSVRGSPLPPAAGAAASPAAHVHFFANDNERALSVPYNFPPSTSSPQRLPLQQQMQRPLSLAPPGHYGLNSSPRPSPLWKDPSRDAY
jgi:hypothetical protein